MLTGSGGFATAVFAFGYGAAPHVQPVPRDVPGDVLRAPLARLCDHAQGVGIGTASQGLKTPVNASRVAQSLRQLVPFARHVDKVMHVDAA